MSSSLLRFLGRPKLHYSIRASFATAIALAAWAGLPLFQSLANDRGADEPATKAEIYGQGVRETDKLTPQQELAGFHLPDGFVAELVASEPQIAKPLNMAFDRHGRLWITDTTEYPYPAPAGTPAHDSIKVLSDEDGDGRFEKVTTFADDLNIPIGILPVDDGVLCFSIPNIMHLQDTDGDGQCDARRVVLGPFDTTRDTHGMVNAMRAGPDGWIYACHGFNNQSHVRAADGSEVHLISGNTFRFRIDGSRVEQFTTGQVNPFGMTRDQWGDWYTADCHSKPVTLLVRGGYNESFGRPSDGLGFVPSIMDHLHGSTAICGIHYYLDDQFPEAFRERFYSGNVMTSRINSNSLLVDRNHIRLVEEPDFMTSDDPWFRPVDLRLGPDGALYVADFYNKIIGHYEVRLDHPDRDRNSGRIWRIRYTGTDGSADRAQTTTSKANRHDYKPVDELLSERHLHELAEPNATRREFALDRFNGVKLSPEQQERVLELSRAGSDRSELLRVSAIWALHRAQLDSPQHLAAALVDSESPLVLVAVLRAWEDQPRSSDARAESSNLLDAARQAIDSEQPQVCLAAAGALGRHGTSQDVRFLLSEVIQRPSEGSITQHSFRMAVKELLVNPEVSETVLAEWKIAPTVARKEPLAPRVSVASDSAPISMMDPAAEALAGVLPAVGTPRAAEALLGYALSPAAGAPEVRDTALRLACKQMQPHFAQPVVMLLEGMGQSRSVSPGVSPSILPAAAANIDAQTVLVAEAIATLRAGQHPIPAALVRLIESNIARLTTDIERELAHAPNKPILWQETQGKMWPLQDRPRTGEANQMHKFRSSHALGEAYVGTLSSSVLSCPAQLSFWIVGHDGEPSEPAGNKTGVRLVDPQSGVEIMTASPPRSDLAVEIRMDLAEWRGRPVRLECFDNDSGSAYAWLAVGDFSVAELNPSSIDEDVVRLTRLIELNVSSMGDASGQTLLASTSLSDGARARLAAGFAARRSLPLSKLLIDLADARGHSAAVKTEIVLGSRDQVYAACKELASVLTAHMTMSQQSQFARSLIGSPEGRQLLIDLFDEGRMALESLRGLQEVLATSASDPSGMRLSKLSAEAGAAPSDLEQKIVQRVSAFKTTSMNAEKGKLVYEKNCANCHKLRGAGQLVGPQLDGVAPRGPERLAEDILLPNRNVDKAFRMSSLLMHDDRVIVGLVRESGNGELQVIGADGKAQNVQPSEIAMRKDTSRSLMPDNFAELLSDEDLSNLLQFVTQP